MRKRCSRWDRLRFRRFKLGVSGGRLALLDNFDGGGHDRRACLHGVLVGEEGGAKSRDEARRRSRAVNDQVVERPHVESQPSNRGV